MDEFLAAGGTVEHFELKDRSDFSALDERGMSVYPRRDGLLVQADGGGGDFFNNREDLNPAVDHGCGAGGGGCGGDEVAMPVISRFYGIVIVMYFSDHNARNGLPLDYIAPLE